MPVEATPAAANTYGWSASRCGRYIGDMQSRSAMKPSDREAAAEGTRAALVDSGAMMLPTGCGACAGYELERRGTDTCLAQGKLYE